MKSIHSKLEKILFLDIETVSEKSNYNELNEEFKNLWYKKSKTFNGFSDDIVDELYQQKAGIFSEFSKIIVICFGYLYFENQELKMKIKTIKSNSEKDLLEEFLLVFNQITKTKDVLCAHNGKEFDFPFIARRLLINQMQIPSILNTSNLKPWEVTHLDTLEMWKFGDRKNYTSLELLAALFKIPNPKTNMSGADVHNVYYNEKNLSKIAEYCSHDVLTTANLFLKFNLLDVINEKNVIFL